MPCRGVRREVKSCTVCSAPIGHRSRSGLCRRHCRTGQFPHPRVADCSDCGVGITAQNKTGRCRVCAVRAMNSDPEHRRKVGEGVRRALQNPYARARKAAVARENARKAYAQPERRKRAREIALRHLQLAFTPEAIERKLANQRAGLARDKRLAWCPPEYRDAYRKLMYSKRMLAAEARPIIEEMIAADRKREEASLTGLDRQMRALRNGAKLVANDHAPSLTNPADYGERKWA